MKSVTEVGAWLARNGFERWVQVFADSEIDGEVLRELSEGDLDRSRPAARAAQQAAQGRWRPLAESDAGSGGGTVTALPAPSAAS